MRTITTFFCAGLLLTSAVNSGLNTSANPVSSSATTNSNVRQKIVLKYCRVSQILSMLTPKGDISAKPLDHEQAPISVTPQYVLPGGVTEIEPLENENAIVVEGTPDGISSMRKVIARMDVRPISILFRCERVQVSFDDLKNVGITWTDTPTGSLHDIETGLDSELIGNAETNPKEIRVIMGKDAVALRKYLASRSIKLPGGPELRAVNNSPSGFTLGNSLGSGQHRGSLLGTYVNPRVNGDSTVTLRIGLFDISAAAAPSGASSDRDEHYAFSLIRTVYNREPMAIGGYHQTTVGGKLYDEVTFITPVIVTTQ